MIFVSVPTTPVGLMKKVYKDVFPIVHQQLDYWRKRASEIPNKELRKQALASIDSKTFHCEGGAILAIIAEEYLEDCITFIVAYQTISDYLDNLCDRSTSLDPKDFRCLHQSMPDALKLDCEPCNYYRCRSDQDDGGYLQELVECCQIILRKLMHYDKIAEYLQELAGYYCDLQVHKHVEVGNRVPRLMNWFETYRRDLPDMEWYEFSACSGSTLGIFCLVAYAFHDNLQDSTVWKIREGYFPFIQGLHILLDYFIDQEEDKIGGDLNFCFYYPSYEKVYERFSHFIENADRSIAGLPHEKFHHLINRGLLGIYLSDEKVHEQKDIKQLAKKILKRGGAVSWFFFYNGRVYRKVQKRAN